MAQVLAKNCEVIEMNIDKLPQGDDDDDVKADCCSSLHNFKGYALYFLFMYMKTSYSSVLICKGSSVFDNPGSSRSEVNKFTL